MDEAAQGAIRDLPVADLKPHPRNYNAHPQAQVDRLAKSLQRYGQRKAVVVQANTQQIIAGHGIWEAARALGLETIRCDVWDCTDAEARAYLVDDNELSRGADPDEQQLADLLRELADEGEPALSFDEGELAALLEGLEDEATGDGSGQGVEHRTLAERFGVPPFTVFDARQGYWQERKRSWLALGIKSEIGRGGQLTWQGEAVTETGLNHYRRQAGRSTPPHGPSVTQAADGTLQYRGARRDRWQEKRGGASLTRAHSGKT